MMGANFSGTYISKEQLYSTASYQQKDLQGIQLSFNELGGWDFGDQNLSNAGLRYSKLANANLSGANLSNASLDSSTLTNANLSNTILNSSTFTSANLRGADVRGASSLIVSNAVTRNMIWPDGHIESLLLTAGVTQRAGAGVKIPITWKNGFSIAPTAAFDLSDNVLIVDYTGRDNPAAQIAALLETGARGGPTKWDGPGINSRTARDDPAFATALGMIDNGLVGYDTIKDNQFGFGLDGGQAIPANSVLVKYTYLGDADLNGRVDGDDLVSFFVGYGAQGHGWANGDFDYSGAIDGDDLTSLLAGYAHQGAPLGAGAPLSAGAPLGAASPISAVAVPEPGALVLGACGLAALLTLARCPRRSCRAASAGTWDESNPTEPQR